MTVAFEVRSVAAALVLDPQDRFRRDRGVGGPSVRPLGGLRYRFIGQVVAGARQPLPEPLRLLVQQTPRGFDVFHGLVEFPDRSRRSGLADGRYVLSVETELYQPFETEVDVPRPRDAYTLELEPGYAYPFPTTSGPTLLRGGLRRPDGTPVEVASVEAVDTTTVPPTRLSNLYRTGPSGEWVLVFPDSQPTGSVTVRITYPDGTVEDATNVAVRAGESASLPQPSLRGLVQVGGIPARGVVVRIPGYPSRAETDAAGRWSYYFPLNQIADLVSVTAVLPDGRSQTQANQQVQPRSTVVVPTFRFP